MSKTRHLLNIPLCVCVCAFVCIGHKPGSVEYSCMCVCVCVCAFVCIYPKLGSVEYSAVCMCVCVCVYQTRCLLNILVCVCLCICVYMSQTGFR